MSTPKQSKFFNYQLHSPSSTTNGDPGVNGLQNSSWIGDESGSPLSSCGGSPTDCDLNKSFSKSDARSESNSKRGRPRSEALTSLMMQGSTSPSAIKCKFCNRVFPRDKSLQAHLRTHTGWLFWGYWVGVSLGSSAGDSSTIYLSKQSMKIQIFQPLLVP
jgi:hypothetical protein